LLEFLKERRREPIVRRETEGALSPPPLQDFEGERGNILEFVKVMLFFSETRKFQVAPLYSKS
jgi:hypothetical protein